MAATDRPRHSPLTRISLHDPASVRVFGGNTGPHFAFFSESRSRLLIFE